jgi:hypothetical protein
MIFNTNQQGYNLRSKSSPTKSAPAKLSPQKDKPVVPTV